jgi:hypothetical protein
MADREGEQEIVETLDFYRRDLNLAPTAMHLLKMVMPLLLRRITAADKGGKGTGIIEYFGLPSVMAV